MSVFVRLKKGLSRTAGKLGKRLDEIIGREDIWESNPSHERDTLEALEEILLEADVGVIATELIIKKVRECRNAGVDISIRALLKREIKEILAVPYSAVAEGTSPQVILVVGVNGTGKTTTVGKLASFLRRSGHSPLICAADTFRAAAVQQLEVWAKRAEVDLVKSRVGADPAAVVFDSIQAGRARDKDVVIVDTAGRLHTRGDLMSELEKIRRVTSRCVNGAPHEVLLVLDATVGQNGVEQARQFCESVKVTGVVLAKLDGTAKGGVAVAVVSTLGVPIQYIGVGEKLGDLLPFSADGYAEGLFNK